MVITPYDKIFPEERKGKKTEDELADNASTHMPNLPNSELADVNDLKKKKITPETPAMRRLIFQFKHHTLPSFDEEPELRFVVPSSFAHCLRIQGCRWMSSSEIRFSGSSTRS